MKIIVLILALLLPANIFPQTRVFGTELEPTDKTTITNTTAVTTRWIILRNPDKLNGQTSLFVAGDLKTGSHSEGMKVRMQLGCCETLDGDTLVADWQKLETVSTTYLNRTFNGNSLVVGRLLSLGNLASTWNKFHLIRFEFSFATSTHTTEVLGVLTTN